MRFLLGSKSLSIAVSEMLFILPNLNNESTHLVLIYFIILNKLSKYDCNKKVPTSQVKTLNLLERTLQGFAHILTEIGALNK